MSPILYTVMYLSLPHLMTYLWEILHPYLQRCIIFFLETISATGFHCTEIFNWLYLIDAIFMDTSHTGSYPKPFQIWFWFLLCKLTRVRILSHRVFSYITPGGSVQVKTDLFWTVLLTVLIGADKNLEHSYTSHCCFLVVVAWRLV